MPRQSQKRNQKHSGGSPTGTGNPIRMRRQFSRLARENPGHVHDWTIVDYSFIRAPRHEASVAPRHEASVAPGREATSVAPVREASVAPEARKGGKRNNKTKKSKKSRK